MRYQRQVQQPKYVPVIKTPETVAKEALKTIREEAQGDQLGLKSRFSSLNVAVGKYFRFKQVYSIAGLSGHGKSILLNILIQDFLNRDLNLNKCVHDYIICHHAFEMNPEDEELRKASTKLGISYNHLLSSEFDPVSRKYNVVTEEEIKRIADTLKEDIDKPIYYFDEPCQLSEMPLNIKAGIATYKQHLLNNPQKLASLAKRKQLSFNGEISENDIPNPKVVITIDHTLLIKQSPTEKDILQTMRNLAKTAIALKKKGYLVIFVGQLNNNIEKIERIKNPEVHYPIKSDIYAQGEIYNACDGVFTIHQPELLGILRYGKNGLHTHKLIHLQVLKMRFGKVGSIWFKNELEKGIITQLDFNQLLEEAKAA